MFKGKTRLFKDNILGDKTCPRSQIIKLVTFGTKGITKENTSLGPRIKFGPVSSQGRSITKVGKRPKMNIGRRLT